MQFRAACVLPLDKNAAGRWRVNVVQERADLQVTSQRSVLAAAVEARFFGDHRLAFFVIPPIV